MKINTTFSAVPKITLYVIDTPTYAFCTEKPTFLLLRLGIELRTSRSNFQRHNHYSSEKTEYIYTYMLNMYLLTQSFGHYAALSSRVYDPVVILEGVHGLQNCADTANASIDVRIRQEVRGQVTVQPGLYRGRRVDPQRGVEQHVVQKLPGHERNRKRLRLAWQHTVRWLLVRCSFVTKLKYVVVLHIHLSLLN